MKRKSYLLIMTLAIIFMLGLQTAAAQQWEIRLDTDRKQSCYECLPIDNGENMLGVGLSASPDPNAKKDRNGWIMKVFQDGSFIYKETHLPDMELVYCCATQLANGNYMVFGVCDDSINTSVYDRYLCVDIFDEQLELVQHQIYCEEDDTFNGFYMAAVSECEVMKCKLDNDGTVVLIFAVYYEEHYGPNSMSYRSRFRFNRLNENGDVVDSKDQPEEFEGDVQEGNEIVKILKVPNSDNYLFFGTGSPYDHVIYGCIGLWHLSHDFTITSREHLNSFGGIHTPLYVATDGRWFDDNYFYITTARNHDYDDSYQSIYKVDSSMHIYNQLDLPPKPNDTASYGVTGTSHAYLNDSTIFVVSMTSTYFSIGRWRDAYIALVDKDLNLLGRKTMHEDDLCLTPCQPVPLNNGSCLVPLVEYTGTLYNGESHKIMRVLCFNRDDFKITWDMVNEDINEDIMPFPNPTSNVINIPVGDITLDNSRIQIFDIQGVKYLDCSIGEIGNLITIDTQNLEAGTYIYQVVSDDRILTKGKFVKEP